MGDLVEIRTFDGRPIHRYEERGDLGTILDNAAVDAWQAWLDDRAMIRREMIAERQLRRETLRIRITAVLLALVALGPLIWVSVR
jgi:hypothetical protein